ncbi:DUF1272 domain-containing protein [Aquidulcibacter paucihalophilus]|uniref:DUF1272 domain-containing protein n=1 Tax=Aquidulcibacter paucihalophilus TaxID=1978549 RepID=UPI000A192D16|nr:DUF1272 domain-containing protein [Aquidulcibacter paucihalophilus]
MLALKPNCECCDRDLAADSAHAFICTFECTYCEDCATERLSGICPACQGNLVPRPIRPAAALARFPGQAERAPLKAACQAK